MNPHRQQIWPMEKMMHSQKRGKGFVTGNYQYKCLAGSDRIPVAHFYTVSQEALCTKALNKLL